MPAPTPALMPPRAVPHAVRPIPPDSAADATAAAAAAGTRPHRAIDRYTLALRHDPHLTAHSRLVALTLASMAVRRSGVILPQYQPTIHQLARWTALADDQVLTAVRYLESHGWLLPRTPADRHFRLGRLA